MIDIKLIRNNRSATEKLLRAKDPEIDLSFIVEQDEQFRDIKTRMEQLKSTRNASSKTIADKKRKGEDTSGIMKEMAEMAKEIDELEKQLRQIEEKLGEALAHLPNLPMEEIPVSLDPKDNVCIKEYKSRPTFTFPTKNHVELNEKLDLFDFKRGAKTSGSGWPVYRNQGARLEWALLNYMIQVHLKNGFELILPPLLVRPNIMYGAGQLPKFQHQVFRLEDKDYPLYLIPTAEVVLNGLHNDEILPAEALPLKYIAYTPCFRREAGAAGSQERGLIRVHQFNKVEMFCFCRPEESEKMFLQMLAGAEEILQGLELHYRNMLLVTGDCSFAAARTVDVEVWLPGQNRYYEVSSISNCTDFQARRSQIRFKEKGGKTELVHTLNGSGLATSRLMVALLENNQNEDGSVNLPKALQPFLGGVTKLN